MIRLKTSLIPIMLFTASKLFKYLWTLQHNYSTAPSPLATVAKKPGDFIFWCSKRVFPTFALAQLPRQQVPSNSGRRRESLHAVFVQKQMASSQPIHISCAAWQKFPNTLFVIQQVLHQGFVCWKILCHICIKLLFLLHIQSVVDDRISDLLRFLGMQCLLPVERVVGNDVDISQRAMRGITWQSFRLVLLITNEQWHRVSERLQNWVAFSTHVLCPGWPRRRALRPDLANWRGTPAFIMLPDSSIGTQQGVEVFPTIPFARQYLGETWNTHTRRRDSCDDYQI